MTCIGESSVRVDALAKVTGEALYPGDYNMPDQAYMKILFADRPHAIIRSIETNEAEKMEGVVAVLTSKDVPVNVYGLIMPDQPVLCGPGSDQPGADRVRFVGDQVALVIADSEEIASQAVQKIVVDYEDLPVITDVLDSMETDAFSIHPERDSSNIFNKNRIRKGDVDPAFDKADVIVEGEYYTPVQEHAYLQPEAGIAYIDEEGRITVVAGGQWTHEDREQIAHSLGIPEEQVRVIYPAIGGAFGGREDMSIQIVLGLAVWRLNQRGIKRPVKIIWSREESIVGHGKRHMYYFKTRWGATKDGKVIAAEVFGVADGGAYILTSTKVQGNATLQSTGPYEIPNVKIDTYAVYTNNLPGAAFRGFGGPQGAFIAESQMNKLADVLGMDPIELRMRNLLREGSLLSVNTPIPPGVSIVQVVEKCAEVGGWKNTADGWKRETALSNPADSDSVKRGVGFACAFKNVAFSFGAPEECRATIELRGKLEIEKAVLRHSAAEVGQGTHTAIQQMAAHALDLPLEKVELILSDTAETDNAGSVSASRMTFMAGNAIKGAANKAMELWQAEERPAVGKFTYFPYKTTPYDPETGECDPNVTYGYVAEVVELEVDTESGHIQLQKVVCADDVGRAVNPQQIEGQIEGGVVQAAGYTLLENFIQEDGYVKTPTLSTYLIPTVLDVPDTVDSVILEYEDPRGPWGIRGMAEMPFLPVAPAVVAAIHDATGVWFNEFPLTPERVLKGLGKLD